MRKIGLLLFTLLNIQLASGSDCASFFRELTCPDTSLMAGPLEWTNEPNEQFKVLFGDGSCPALFKAAGSDVEQCKSQVKVCANKKTGKLHGSIYACNESRKISLNFEDGKLMGSYAVYATSGKILAQGIHKAKEASREVASVKEKSSDKLKPPAKQN